MKINKDYIDPSYSVSVDTAITILECKLMKLKSEDRALVCTDGIWNKITRNELYILSCSTNFKLSVKQIEKRLKTQAEDN